MADRYQSRPFPADDDHRGGDPRASGRDDSDPLAELARLIGQTDPFSSIGRANLPLQTSARNQYQEPARERDEDGPSAGPPPWMQRATQQESTPQDYPETYPSAPHPVQRYAQAHVAPEPDYHQTPTFDEADHNPNPSRYDDVLYGEPDPGVQESQHDAYADDPYYRDGDGVEEHVLQKRRGGMITVVVILALAVVGTGAAFAYRTYVGSPRSGEPPIIRADAGPTKIVPTPSDGITKVPDRLTAGDGAERIVSREETPVDINAKSGARVVFPGLNPNGYPPSAASVAPSAPPAASGTLSSNEPRKIKTVSVRGEQSDGSAAPPSAAKPAVPVRTAAAAPSGVPRSVPSAANANASSGNAPLSLAPQAAPTVPPADAQSRVAAVNPLQTVPSGAGGSGGYLVQVSSQRSEADAQASYRALQGKFPTVLGSRNSLIKRADLGDKGVYYRAMVGPFGSPDEASQFCGSLKTAGGQCVVQRN